jgi:5-methylcytosine-specific restriction protein A
VAALCSVPRFRVRQSRGAAGCMTETFHFFPVAADEEIEREKAKARDLRRTRWWRNKCAKGACYYCGTQVGAPNLTMDHVVPLVRGGKSTKNNLVPACKQCNNRKKYLLPLEWEEYLMGLKE